MARSPKKRQGYRRQRLDQQRAQRLGTWQSVTLYVLAGVVALAAVLGSIYLAHRLTAKHVKPTDASFLGLVTVGTGEPGRQPVSALVLYEKADNASNFFLVPRSTLLVGDHGEYLLAGDVMAQPAYTRYLARVVGAPIQYRMALSYADLERLTGEADLDVTLTSPVTVQLNGVWRTYQGEFTLPGGLLTAALSANGQSGPQEALFEAAVLRAALQAAATRQPSARASAVSAVTSRDGAAAADARDILTGLLTSHLWVGQLPANGQTNEGQFVYRPDPAQIMAQITRRTPGFVARYTVQVENGSGEIGVGQLALRRLAVLDVNLPAPVNAPSFTYRQTQIVAGSQALAVAQQVRAILGRGVVLGDTQLPATSVVVIIGKDLTAKDLR